MGNSIIMRKSSLVAFPIGSIYMSVDYNFDPNKAFGGTWQKIVTDAYLKIVSASGQGGVAGGTSSDHKIPIESIPAHNHSYTNYYSSSSWAASGSGDQVPNRSSGTNTGSAGGGQAYYPYYVGMYVWKRTA